MSRLFKRKRYFLHHQLAHIRAEKGKQDIDEEIDLVLTI